MTSPNFAIIAISAFVLSGCMILQEPYPGWSVSDISYDDLPRRVKAAFHIDFPDAHVTKVERSTFESRMSGHPKKFRLFFESVAAESQRAIYDERGKREEGFDFWFDEIWRTPNKLVETNRRPAFPFEAGRQFESASCAPPSRSAAVVHR